MKLISCFLIFALLFSCSDNDMGPALAGEYSGTFYRTRDNVKIIESSITLTFENGKFSGGGSDHQSPAICNGNYSQNGSEIKFNNECFFTANFDWTLILSETFVIKEIDGAFLLAKEIDSANGDYYLLSNMAAH